MILVPWLVGTQLETPIFVEDSVIHVKKTYSIQFGFDKDNNYQRRKRIKSLMAYTSTMKLNQEGGTL